MGGRMGGGRNLTRVRVGDGSAHMDLQWWNQPFREKQFQPGMQLFLYGRISEFGGSLQMDSPEFEVMGEDNSLQVGRIVPVYPMTEGLFQTAIRRAIGGALERCAEEVEDALPPELRQRFELAELAWCLRQIHFPDDLEQKERARLRLVFEELFLLQVALAQKKMAAHVEEVGIRHIVPEEEIKGFLAALPFKLTGAQRRVMNEIRKDLKSPRPMNRLLHGDVGSGKTVVAAYALWTAFATGYQGALLAPTEILAEQHFSVLTRLLKPLGVEVALLEGSLKAANKRRIRADIAEGRAHVVIGTHAIIQEDIEFHRLSVCVVDEQHRFGVMQRAALQQKGAGGLRPDVLVMTATPIPRTLALTVYGDLDVSTLDELPPGRQPIKTVSVKPQSRARAYKFVLDEVKKGRQAYVVCPLVEESEKLAQLQAATALAERLRHEELHDFRVGLLHGQMNVIERDEEMELFRAGMRDVLVSTTVIEVGVDVPNATVMLIEDADRFGLSQLHQLRGRVGRGQHASTCVLLANPKTEEGRSRISVMTKTQNGFEIAEHDLNLRGPGEFYGTRQSGMPDFRLANIIRDVDIIAQAREAAFELIAADPHLQWDEHQVLKSALRRFWGDKLNLVQVS
jgi:ATP-dependent DNA helicase RecG